MVSEAMCLNTQSVLLVVQGYSVTQGGELVFKQLHFCCWFCLLPLEFLSWTMKNLAVSASSHSEHCFSLQSRKVVCGKAVRDQILSFFMLFTFQFSCSRTVLWSLHWQANIADFVKPSRTLHQQLLSLRTAVKTYLWKGDVWRPAVPSSL